jgi:hypothetical protein
MIFPIVSAFHATLAILHYAGRREPQLTRAELWSINVDIERERIREQLALVPASQGDEVYAFAAADPRRW